jgi:hypothetical protein
LANLTIAQSDLRERMGGSASRPTAMSTVVQFKPRRADRTTELATLIIELIKTGKDAHQLVREFLAAAPGLSVTEANVAFMRAHRVVEILRGLVIEKLHADGGGQSA